MTVKMPGAVWRPIDENHGGERPRTDGIVFHVAASNGDSLHGWFSNPAAEASSHLYVRKSGVIEQYVSLDLVAWTSGQGNDRTIGVETEGKDGEPWTQKQLESCAKIAAYCADKYNFPLRLMESSKSEKGIGWHRLGVNGNFPALPSVLAGREQRGGGEVWSSSRGKSCPGDDRIRQMPELLRLAKGDKPAPTPEPDPKGESVTRSISEAIRWAKVRRRGYGGLCLRFSRKAYGIGPKYPSARIARKHTKTFRATSSTAGIPRGAFLWMDRAASRYGHVAIYLGNGYMATTDSSQSTTQVVKVDYWRQFGWKVLGWSWDCNGVTVTGKGGSGHGATLVVDGSLGPATIRAWQEWMGTTVDGVISKPSSLIARVQASLNRQHDAGLEVDGYLGPNTIKALQAHFGTPVDGVTSDDSLWVRALQRQLNRGK